MIRHQVYRKKSLKKLQHATENVQAELEYRNIMQIDLGTDNPDPLSVQGVIYVIIHIPSNKIYVGQTIQECYTRFKRHWHDRHLGDGRSLNLHRLMKKQKIHNFMIWPLEVIDKTQYYDKNGVPDLRLFRRAASIRERFWIQRLQTTKPRGLNSNVPLGRTKNLRKTRPGRWLQKKDSVFADRLCTSCVEMKEDNIFIHLHQGPDHHIRSTANKLLYMAKEYSEKDILTDMANMSHTHRIGILRWLNENIPNEQANERVFLIERLLRELQDKRAEGLKQNCKEFVNFIKLVHPN